MFNAFEPRKMTASMLGLTLTACIADDDGRARGESERDEGSSAVFEKRVSHSRDDAEEKPSGTVYLHSSDLEFARDDIHDTVLVGMRFTNVTVPPGATIDHAYVQLTADEVHSGATDLVIRAHDTDDAGRFKSKKHDISSRPLTSATVDWTSLWRKTSLIIHLKSSIWVSRTIQVAMMPFSFLENQEGFFPQTDKGV